MMRRLIYLAMLCVACSSCAALGDHFAFETSTHPTDSAGSTNYPPPGRVPGPDYY